MLARGLREHAYAVDVAADGEAALAHLDSTDYDAVILDVMLPHVDGLTVCRRLRAAGAHVPILVVTARDGVDALEEGLVATVQAVEVADGVDGATLVDGEGVTVGAHDVGIACAAPRRQVGP